MSSVVPHIHLVTCDCTPICPDMTCPEDRGEMRGCLHHTAPPAEYCPPAVSGHKPKI